MDKFQNGLLANHLAFLATHRGTVRRTDAAIYIESDRPEFCYAVIEAGARLDALLPQTHALQLLPTAGISAETLQTAGFTPVSGISYMVLGVDSSPGLSSRWRVREDLAVVRVDDAAKMDVFSEVQSQGFNESEVDFARWHPWLRAANQRNLGNPDQGFYVGYLAGEAAGTALTVRTDAGGMVGIYAVATLPARRRLGVSTSLLAAVVAEAQSAGATVVTLQVKQDSPVEDFYRNLGFQRVFVTPIYHRTI